MPRHEDLTYNVDRTHEELQHIGYSIDEINVVIDGYPELDRRLYVPQGVEIPSREITLLRREVTIYEIPGGHDASNSSVRDETLRTVSASDMLYGPADIALLTGTNWYLNAEHPAIVRALREGCRDFTQHLQPLVPGWRQLLALRTPSGERPLGMPTGIGWYTHYGLLPMCDAATARLSRERDDIEFLLYMRPSDNQSEWVWAAPGGYVVPLDTTRPRMTPLQAASVRRTGDRTQRNVSRYKGVPLRVKYPVSSGNTLVAGLKTTPYGRFIHNPDHAADPAIDPQLRPSDIAAGMAGYVSLRALCEYNPTGGVSGKNHGENPFPIWTTHFEYLVAALYSLIDPENQHRFGMTNRQFGQTVAVATELQDQFPMLQAA